MAVLLVRIDHPPGGEQLAVRGYAVERTDEGWDEDLRAESLLPRDQEIFTVARSSVLSDGDPDVTPGVVGAGLWRMVLDGEVGEWWRASTRGAPPRTVRTILDVRADELVPVPWELMADEGRR